MFWAELGGKSGHFSSGKSLLVPLSLGGLNKFSVDLEFGISSIHGFLDSQNGFLVTFGNIK